MFPFLLFTDRVQSGVDYSDLWDNMDLDPDFLLLATHDQ